jgi:hypothetical protein
VETLQHLITKFGYRCNERALVAAIRKRDLECIKLLAPSAHDLDKFVLTECAAEVGDLKILKYFIENLGYTYDNRATTAAANAGHLKCLEFLDNRQGQIVRAAQLGDLKAIRRLIEERKYVCDKSAPLAAARFGHVECLMYLIQECDCPYDAESTIKVAILQRRLPCVQFLVGTLKNQPTAITLDLAVESKDDGIIQYIFEKIQPEDKLSTFSELAKTRQTKVLEKLLPIAADTGTLVNCAAVCGYLELMCYLLFRGGPLPGSIEWINNANCREMLRNFFECK